MNRFLKQILCFSLLGFLAACGNHSASKTTSNTSPQTGPLSPSAPQGPSGPISPGNLPAPSAQSQAISQESFFQRKRTLDSFSSPLKKQVQANYQQTPQNTSSNAQNSSSQGVIYNTLFGPVSGTGSKNFVKVESTEQVNRLTLTDQNGNTYKFADKSTTAPTTGSCGTLATQFLCVTAPVEGQGFVQNTIRVLGAVNIAQAALFAYTDPVAIISIFRQDGTPVSEFSVTASDLAISDTVTGPENARVREATFAKDLQLGGVGQYTLVVSSFKDSPDSVQMVSITRNIFYQDVPQIQLVSIEPPSEEPGNLAVDSSHRHDAVRDGAQVSMKQVVIKVALTSQGTDHVGIVFENYDAAGNRRYVSTGDTDFTDLQVESRTLKGKIAKLPLFEGVNRFQMWVHNTLLEERGLSRTTPTRISFSLTNTLPTLGIQLKGTSPRDGNLVEANSASPQAVTLQFCVTQAQSPDVCLTTLSENDKKPIVVFNGLQIPPDQLQVGSDGIFTVSVQPQFGNNSYSISAKQPYTLNNPRPGVTSQEIADFYTGKLAISFNYGKLNKLYDSTGPNARYGFTERGVSLELARNVFAVQVKRVLEKFLENPNSTDFKNKFVGFLKQDRVGPSTQCREIGESTPVPSNSSIEIDPTQLQLGRFEVIQLETTTHNSLDVTLRIHGLHAPASVVGIPPGDRSGALRLRFTIQQLTLQLSVKFKRQINGYYTLDILPQEGARSAVQILGDAPTGRIVRVEAPAGLRELDERLGVVGGSVKEGFERAILCGIEQKINGDNGTAESFIPNWSTELHNLIDTPEQARAEARAAGRPQADIDAIETNVFRLPLEFALFGKNLGLNVSYDLLHSDNISFDERGLHIWNMPVRLTPNNTVLALLNNLPQETKNILGTIIVPKLAAEPRPRVNLTDENRNLALQISEDAINQALSAANLGILSNTVLEPNTFTNANGTYSFIYQAVPVVEDFLNKNVDINQNGVSDDARWPLRIALKPDVHFSPHFHYLTDAETRALSDRLSNNDGASAHRRLNPNLKYFKLSLANLGLEFYRVDPLPNSYKTFCSLKSAIKEDLREQNLRALLPKVLLETADADNATKRACQQSLSATFPSAQGFCPRDPANPGAAIYDEFVVPTQNGPVISAVPGATPPKPMVTLQANLTVYGVVQGVFRETLMADRYEIQTDSHGVPVIGRNGAPQLQEKPGYKPSNFVRIKILDISNFNPLTARVTENYTSVKEEDLIKNLQEVVVKAALNVDCERFNEIQIPIPDRYPSLETQADCATLEAGQIPQGMSDADVESLRSTCDTVKKLQDFGLHHLDLGDDLNDSDSNQQLLEHPELAADGINPLYLDLKMHLGMCLIGEGCAQ